MSNTTRYKDCRTLGIAIQVTGNLLRPFLREHDSLNQKVNALQNPADLGRFYPLEILLELFEIAKEKNYVERLAKSWAINVVREMRRSGSVSTPLMALKTIEAGFPTQHQGNVGAFTISPIDANRVTLVDSTYAPCGYIATFAKQSIANFGAVSIRVEHLKTGCRDNGDPACEYLISWKESDLLKMGKTIKSNG